MVKISQLRSVCRQFLYNITRHDKISLNDIRLIKYGTGVMPRKLIALDTDSSKFKEVPYLNDDEFIVFDIIVNANTVSEYVGDQFRSLMPFTLVVNIYGDESSDELQYMMSRLTSFQAKNFLYSNGISIEKEPDEIQILDGKENGIWWVRRRVEIRLNTEQVINLTDIDMYHEFDTIEENIEDVKGVEN